MKPLTKKYSPNYFLFFGLAYKQQQQPLGGESRTYKEKKPKKIKQNISLKSLFGSLEWMLLEAKAARLTFPIASSLKLQNNKV